jgi:signal transduction histidine kinase
MELIQNCLKHANATEVTLELNFFDDRLNIICDDNGQGMSTKGDGIGLRNLNSRVFYLGGDINIDSNTYGTTIIINIPVNPSL